MRPAQNGRAVVERATPPSLFSCFYCRRLCRFLIGQSTSSSSLHTDVIFEESDRPALYMYVHVHGRVVRTFNFGTRDPGSNHTVVNLSEKRILSFIVLRKCVAHLKINPSQASR